MVRFIDRFDETGILEKDWKNSGNAFIVVFGRRRIGKTRLIEEFLRGKDGVKYTADDVNKKIQMTECRRALSAYLNDDFLANQEITEWGALFSYLGKTLPKGKRFYIWLDEFSYLIKNDYSMTSAMQKFIDGFLRDSRLFLIVSGSVYGIMSEDVLSHSSPLYGRRTRDILLRRIPFPYLKEFVQFDFEGLLKTEFVAGGVPEYLQVASRCKTFEVFMSAEFLRPDGYFYREPYFLLSQEFKEIKTYFSILNAIAYGNSKPTDIANFVGIKGREIYPYLESLISYGFVERETSLLRDGKKGVYRIKDNFLDFWFNIVHKNREQIERGPFKADKGELNAYFGKRFEMFIRENTGALFGGRTAGRWWHDDKEIDLVALDEKGTSIVFGECKWEDGTDAQRVARELAAKIPLVKWKNEGREEQLAIFSKSFRKKISDFEGRRVSCFDLKDLERILR